MDNYPNNGIKTFVKHEHQQRNEARKPGFSDNNCINLPCAISRDACCCFAVAIETSPASLDHFGEPNTTGRSFTRLSWALTQLWTSTDATHSDTIVTPDLLLCCAKSSWSHLKHIESTICTWLKMLKASA